MFGGEFLRANENGLGWTAAKCQGKGHNFVFYLLIILLSYPSKLDFICLSTQSHDHMAGGLLIFLCQRNTQIPSTHAILEITWKINRFLTGFNSH